MNICSCFVDKCESECYNKTPSSSLGGVLYDILQRIIRTKPLSLNSEDLNGNSPIFAVTDSSFLPLFFKEDMHQQEKQRNLTELLKLLATTPSGDKYMQFVLQLAENPLRLKPYRS